MRKTICSLVLAVSLTLVPVQAQDVDLQDLDKLQLSEAQVQDLFSLFLSKAPLFLSTDSVDSEAMMLELAPKALNILEPEQRRILSKLAPEEHLEHFGSMTQDERTRFVLDSAKGLVHPSKQEWLQRIEEMIEDTDR